MRSTCLTIAASAVLASAAFADPPVSGTIDPGKIGGAFDTGRFNNPRTIPPQIDLVAAEVGRLSKLAKEQAATIDKLRADLDEQKKSFTFLVQVVNGNRATFLAHKHTYQRPSVLYWNHKYVTSGRPIVKSETKEWGSWIESVKDFPVETSAPLP